MTAADGTPTGTDGASEGSVVDTDAARARLDTADPSAPVPDWAAALLTAALDELDLLRDAVAAADEWNEVSRESTLRAAGKRARYRNARAALDRPTVGGDGP